jgi:iron-sulfur cluster assembly protein
MKLDEPSIGDILIEESGVRIILDPDSAPLLRGSRLDFKDDLHDSGFRLENPNAARSCGCGTSFEPGPPAPVTELSHPA